MAFNWPVEFTPQLVSWEIQKAGVGFRSPMAGTLESIEFPGAFWKVHATLPDLDMDAGVGAQAFFSRMAGGVERVLVPYWMRPEPLGTMRGTPTLQSAVARGATQLLLSATGTLKRGDMLGLDGTLFQVFTDCAAVSGVITVPTVNRARRAIGAGAVVTWATPTMTALVPSQVNISNFEPGKHGPLAIDLEEG